MKGLLKTVRCPHCSNRVMVPSSGAAKVECVCKHRVTVDAVGRVSTTPPPPPPAPILPPPPPPVVSVPEPQVQKPVWSPSMKRSELREIARKAGIEVSSNATKARILTLLGEL